MQGTALQVLAVLTLRPEIYLPVDTFMCRECQVRQSYSTVDLRVPSREKLYILIIKELLC